MNTRYLKISYATRNLVRATTAVIVLTLFAPWPLQLQAQAQAQAFDKAKLQACPYTVAELKSALAIDLKPGKGNEQPYPEGRLLGCSYSGTSGSPSVFVSQTWIPSKILGETLQSMDRYASGQFTPVARDADGARWLSDAQQKNQIALIYTRGNVRSELRLVGSRPLAADAQARMLKLRRVP